MVHNGIDTEEYAPDPGTDVLERLGIDPARPSVTFVGRITRQKGLPYLLRAARSFAAGGSAGAAGGRPGHPGDPGRGETLVGAARPRDGVVWVREMLPKPEVIQVLSHTTVFVCPSIYEPMGIVNLEAMACEAAVVATATGGIPEVVADGETGSRPDRAERPTARAPRLTRGGSWPISPSAVNALLADPERARRMGAQGGPAPSSTSPGRGSPAARWRYTGPRAPRCSYTPYGWQPNVVPPRLSGSSSDTEDS